MEMASLLGNRVRYPCDPAAPDGGGCLLCVFNNPRVIGSSNLFLCDGTIQPPPTYYCENDLPNPDTISTHINMECKYAPSNVIVRTLNAFFRVAGMGDVSSDDAVMRRIKILDFRNEQWIGVMGEG
jgi:hypothetical protein